MVCLHARSYPILRRPAQACRLTVSYLLFYLVMMRLRRLRQCYQRWQTGSLWALRRLRGEELDIQLLGQVVHINDVPEHTQSLGAAISQDFSPRDHSLRCVCSTSLLAAVVSPASESAGSFCRVESHRKGIEYGWLESMVFTGMGAYVVDFETRAWHRLTSDRVAVRSCFPSVVLSTDCRLPILIWMLSKASIRLLAHTC